MDELQTINITENALLEGPQDPEGRVWSVVLIEGGFNRSRQRYYTQEAMQSIANLASNNQLHCYANHMSDAKAKEHPAGDVNDVVGWYTDVTYQSETDRVVGKLNMLMGEASPYPHLPVAMKEAYDRGNANLYELSIRGAAESKIGHVQGEKTQIVKGLKVLASTDLVTRGGAGGAIQTILESDKEAEMPEELLQKLDSMSIGEVKDLIAKSVHKDYIGEGNEGDGGGDPDPVSESVVTEPSAPTSDAGLTQEAVSQMIEAAVSERVKSNEGVSLRNEQVRQSGLPLAMVDRLITRVGTGELDTEDKVQEAIVSESAFLNQINPSGFNNPIVLDPNYDAKSTKEGWDKYRNQFTGMMKGEKVGDEEPFTSLREAYFHYRQMVGRPMNPTNNRGYAFAMIKEMEKVSYDPVYETDPSLSAALNNDAALQESIASGYGGASAPAGYRAPTWVNLFGTSMYRVFMDVYADVLKRKYMDYRMILSHSNETPTFNRYDWIRQGLYENVRIVREGAEYTALTDPGEEQVNTNLVKYGGTVGITMEAVADDSLNAIRTIPRNLAIAIHVDRYRQVFDLFTVNSGAGPAMDYNAPGQNAPNNLFHANHSNLSAAAFSAANLQASRLAMMEQTALSSARTLLHMQPKFVLVPLELLTLAEKAYNSEYDLGAGAGAVIPAAANAGTGAGGFTNDPNPLKGRIQPISVPYWTDADNWYLVADPMEAATIGEAYFPGHREPMLLTQDNPTVGDVFDRDVTTVKVRDIRDYVVMDHRSFRGHIVT